MRARQLAMLLAVAALWGASFLFIRVASPVLGPARLVDLRMALAGAALLHYALARGRRLTAAGRSWQWLVIGALWALPFTLIAIAELHLTASLAAILNATTPFFSALLAAGWLKQPLTAAKAAGLASGLAGVLLVVGWSPVALNLTLVASAAASLLAAATYALAGVYGARTFAGVPSLTLATGQQLAGALLLAPLAAAAAGRSPDQVGGRVLLAVLGLGLLCTAWAFVLFFQLVAEVGPTSALTVTFLVPVFGVLWGALFLGEPVGWSLLAGVTGILAGVALVTGAIRPATLARLASPTVFRARPLTTPTAALRGAPCSRTRRCPRRAESRAAHPEPPVSIVPTSTISPDEA